MTQNKLTIFNHDRAIYTAETDDNDELLNFSGPLVRDLVVTGSPFSALWVTAAVQSGKCVVRIDYTDATSAEYEVSLGRPLLIETRVGAIGQSVTTVSFIYQGSCSLEASVTRSNRPIGILPPRENLLLGLLAEGGVTTDGNGVLSWEDADASAPIGETFDAAPLSQPQLNESDAAFNNRPTIEWDGSGQTLLYSGAIADGDPLITGDFTVAAIVEVSDDLDLVQTIVSNLVAGAGVELVFTEHYVLGSNVDNGIASDSSTSRLEPIRRPMVVVLRFQYYDDPTQGVIQYYRQGATLSSGGPLSLPTGAGADDLLAIGSRPDGSAPLKGKIAELYLYDIVWGSEEQENFISYAEAKYALDNDFYRNNTEFSQVYLTAQRGLTLSTATGVGFYDALSAEVGGTVGDGDFSAEAQQATSGAGTGTVASFSVSGETVSNIVVDTEGTDFVIGDTVTFLDPTPGDPEAVTLTVNALSDGVASWVGNLPSNFSLPFESGSVKPELRTTGPRHSVRWPALRLRERTLVSTDLPSYFNALLGLGPFTVSGVVESFAEFRDQQMTLFSNGGITIEDDPPRFEGATMIDNTSSEVNYTALNSAGGNVIILGSQSRSAPSALYAFVMRFDGTNIKLRISGLPEEERVSTASADVDAAFALTLGGPTTAAGALQDEPLEGGISEMTFTLTFDWSDELVDNFFAWANSKYGTAL